VDGTRGDNRIGGILRVKVFTLPWLADGTGFDDRAVASFMESHRVVDVAQHFFVHEKTPVLVLIVSYREGAESGRPSGELRRTAEDVGQGLEPEARRRFSALRAWRNQYARQSGKPPYVLFTNRQAAEMARLNPGSLAALSRIEGIGQARLDEFGEALLAVLRAVSEDPMDDAVLLPAPDSGPAGEAPEPSR